MIWAVGRVPQGLAGREWVEALGWEQVGSSGGSGVPEAVWVAYRDDTEFFDDLARLMADPRVQGVPVGVHSPVEDELGRLLCHTLGVVFALESELTPGQPVSVLPHLVATEVLHPVYRHLLYESLGGAFRKIDDLEGTLGQLRRTLSFICEADVAVFTLRMTAQVELFIFLEPSVSQRNYEYFLKFCKQDILVQDRYVNLDAVLVRHLSGLPAVSGRRRTDDRPLGSYASYPLADRNGRSLGLLHLGSFRNQYFNESVGARIQSLTPTMGQILACTLGHRDMVVRHRGLRGLFSKFLPDPVINRLLESDGLVNTTAGRRQEVAILFSDIRSFTSITERNGAEAVVGFLNRHFQAMVTQITAEGGVVDKFIGDAIVAVFGMEEGALGFCDAAARTALRMVTALAEVEVSSLLLDGGQYGIGIGLHVGEVVVGYIGSQEKTAYTVIGKTIDLAEELESATKLFKTKILASEGFRLKLTDPILGTRPVGILESDGKEIPVHSVEKAMGTPGS